MSQQSGQILENDLNIAGCTLTVLAVQEVDEELFGLFVDSLHLLHVFELIVRRHDDWADLAAPFERLEILLIQVEPGMPQYLCDSFVSKSHFLLHFQQLRQDTRTWMIKSAASVEMVVNSSTVSKLISFW